MGYPELAGVDPEQLKSLPGYNAWKIMPYENLTSGSWEEKVEHILRWSLLAPSPHNKQGWSTTLKEQSRTLTVWPKQKDIGTPSDVKGRQTYISIGCFAENTRTALRGFGLSPVFEIVEDVPENYDRMWGVQFDLTNIEEARLTRPELFQLMRERRTYRGRYEPNYLIDRDILEEMCFAAEKQNLKLKLVQDRATRIALGELQAVANRVVILNPRFRHELAEHLVPNDSLQRRVMPGDTFGLSDTSARNVNKALKAEGQFDGDFATGFANADRDGIVSSSAVGVISVSEDVPIQWIRAGMVFEQIWLLAQKHSLSVGVMAAMVESEAHNILLKTRLVQARLRPTVVFRLGKSIENRPHSPRIEVEQLFEAEH